VGSAAEILKMATPDTRIVNANGQTITLPDGTHVGGALRIVTSDDGAVHVTAG
jgi:hypothetical protein